MNRAGANILVDVKGRPLRQSLVSGSSRDSGALRGSISNYRPRRTGSQSGQSAERALTQHRAQDLYANDFAARSAIDSISTNAVGIGLTPQPRIPWRRLSITEEQAHDVKEQMEWIWARWCVEAHLAGTMHFEDLQLAGIRSLLRLGEMLHLPVFLEPDAQNGRTFSLVIQELSPLRLGSPADMQSDPFVREGVHLSEYGQPLGYWIAAPSPSVFNSLYSQSSLNSLSSIDYRYVPARIAHRPGIFHLYRRDEEEQTRGISSLSTDVKLFRNLADAIDHELMAQVLAASFPVFISLEEGRADLPDAVMEQYNLALPPDEEARYYQNIDPGVIMYGNQGEKPHILESKRPSQNFMAFVELILRAQGASAGISYETMFKDFSKSNYSSARAALNEDWKTFILYRDHFARRYCQPIWQMVQEEAYLRGLLTLPPQAPGFYEAHFLWCNTYWYGPSRGYVDPVKEIQANLLAIKNRLMTRTEAIAERGGDFDECMDTIEAEDRRLGQMPQAAPV